jgi:hypothetical protein
LTKIGTGAIDATAISSYSDVSNHLLSQLPPASNECLQKLSLYESAMYDAEAVALAVAKRVCFGNEDSSRVILQQVVHICS